MIVETFMTLRESKIADDCSWGYEAIDEINWMI
jgi:hypothetical protein